MPLTSLGNLLHSRALACHTNRSGHNAHTSLGRVEMPQVAPELGHTLCNKEFLQQGLLAQDLQQDLLTPDRQSSLRRTLRQKLLAEGLQSPLRRSLRQKLLAEALQGSLRRALHQGLLAGASATACGNDERASLSTCLSMYNLCYLIKHKLCSTCMSPFTQRLLKHPSH
jgi:hypothetical protein